MLRRHKLCTKLKINYSQIKYKNGSKKEIVGKISEGEEISDNKKKPSKTSAYLSMGEAME